jgi:class 3 adenylate cyclase/tetratricopeptide (TPR) repeat protein
VICPSCGAKAPEGARFCPSCGQPLQTRADERRIVTVLFADLVGFTSLSETRDPEQVKDLVDRCFERLVADITAFGGRVDKIVGDAIVALFGAPVAHEDDAERAVRGALQMQQTLAAVAAEVGVNVQLRIGVNTGEVLVGALRAGGDYTAMGDVVNVASRLQSLAEPGQVVVGQDSWVLTREVMQYESLGSVQVRGRDEAVDAWAAVAALAPPGRRPRRTPTPLVGRDHEIGLLRHALATAVARRRPQFVLLVGEAGIGKSRLAEEIASIASAEYGAAVLEGRCVPYGEANVWWPIAEALRQVCEIGAEDATEQARQKCERAVSDSIGIDPASSDGGVLVEGLLYLMGHEDALQSVDPARAREQARRAVHALIDGVARERLLVVVLSELHWADPLVLELIDDLFHRSRGLPVVLVATARPELEGRWAPAPGRHNAVVLHIDPLDDESAARLVTALLGERPPADLRAVLLERSGGNPFFLEEMVSLLAEAGVLTREGSGYRVGETAMAGDLPATLRGLVAARLDALSPEERATLEDAAVTGHNGPLEALDALAASRGVEAEPCVDELLKKDLLELDDDEWSFRSDLVREVAYETLTKAERARRHFVLADWLGRRADEDLQQVAHHYGAAALIAQELGSVPGVPDDVCPRALKTIERAAHWAYEQDIPMVSVRLLDQAQELLADDDHYNRRRLLLARAHARSSLRQLDLARADLAALNLGEEVPGATPTQVKAWRAHYLSVLGDIEQKEGDNAGAIATLDQAIELWRDVGEPHEVASALRNVGFAKLLTGDLAGSEAAITEALAMFRDMSDRRGEGWALQHLAWIAFSRGEMSEAEERLGSSLAMFEEANDIGGKGWALGLLGFVRYFQGDLEQAGQIAEKIVPVGRELGDRWALGMSLVLLGSVRLWTGDPMEAITHSTEAREIFESISDRAGELMALAPLVRALAATGAVEEALEVIRTTDIREGMTYAGPDTFAGLLPAAVALQIGDPDMAERAMAAKPSPTEQHEDFVGRGEELVDRGLIALQRGQVEDAIGWLRRADEWAHSDGERAHARGWLAVALCSTGEPAAALDTAASINELAAGTYLDHAVGATAEGFAFFQLQQRPEGERAFAKAMGLVDGTGDRLSQAVYRLAYGHALDGLADESAAEVLGDARERLQAMGAAAAGWDTAYALAASASTTAAR